MLLSAVVSSVRENAAAAAARLGTDPAALVARTEELCALYARIFPEDGDAEVSLFSAPGRCELCGNHTDHNKGAVMAAAVGADTLAIAGTAGVTDGCVRLKSVGHDEDVVPTAWIAEPDERRFFTSGALIAGVEKGFLDRGYRVGGFHAVTTSSVPSGGGLSSSAAFENLIGVILSYLYNDGTVPATVLAEVGQAAENRYFGKPCGLMDQMASAVGGVLAIDFGGDKPAITPLAFSPEDMGLCLCLTDTGSSHADLNADYAAVPAEMKAVAALLGHGVLREGSREEVLLRLPEIREKLGDRAALRALHFYGETERVLRLAEKLSGGVSGDEMRAEFASCLIDSGRSSSAWLQNIWSPAHPEQQAVSLALCLTEAFLRDKGGIWRVHGGGFAGSILAFVPEEHLAAYRALMDGTFGEGKCRRFRVRPAGAVQVLS